MGQWTIYDRSTKRELYNEEGHNSRSSPNIIRIMKSMRIRWAGHVARIVVSDFGAKSRGKKPLGRPRHRWEDRIETYLGRFTAQAASRRLSNAAFRVQFQVTSCGICGGQSGTGAGFLRVLRFPLPILIPPTVTCPSIIRGSCNRPVSGPST
jgi:hypothetical protein